MSIFNVNIFKKGVGVDLGTCNTLIYLRRKGIVLREPSMVAFNNVTNRITAVGKPADKMFCRTPHHITALSPISNGVISDFDIAKEMLKRFFAKSCPWSFNTLVVSTIPIGLTEVERKSIEDLYQSIGASTVFFVSQPVAAALGSHLNIDQPQAILIVDIGGGVTNIALLSAEGVVISEKLKVAGNQFNRYIINFIQKEAGLIIGEKTAERIKIEVGTALGESEKLDTLARGRDVNTGLPREIVVKSSHIQIALEEPLKIIVDSIAELIERAPVELAGDIYKNGIYICGGSSLLRGIDKFLARQLSIKVSRVDDPIGCLSRGTGVILEDFKKYRKFLEVFPKNQVKI